MIKEALLKSILFSDAVAKGNTNCLLYGYHCCLTRKAIKEVVKKTFYVFLSYCTLLVLVVSTSQKMLDCLDHTAAVLCLLCQSFCIILYSKEYDVYENGVGRNLLSGYADAFPSLSSALLINAFLLLFFPF